uniref:uncharacterized protein LOC122582716 n=1 Tax=Erigeron canadensis TaxID=72917 RepID=UPI001CB9C8F5|nr:uncharacterized protein LOC122582716 [Erigeron canadensis]
MLRKTILTVSPDELSKLHWINVGFGVCPNTLDPKIVKITRNTNQVEVFTLSLRAWRSPLSNTCPRESISFGSQVVVDGFIYWDASDRIEVGGLCRYDILIMSFDLTSEEFTELYHPNSCDHDLLSNLRESLGVVEFIRTTHINYFNIWIMKGCGCTRSFEKLYSISTFDVSIEKTLGFRRSGAPVIEIENDSGESTATLAVYDPKSKDITEVWSSGMLGSFCVHSYMETLLLLDY